MTYRTTVGITVFGEPAGYSASALISEFQSFVMTNSQFDVVITQSMQAPLSDAEFYTWDGGISYFPTPQTLSDANKQILAQDVQINMILYDWTNKQPTYGGAMWGGDNGINGVPFIAIPLGAWPWVDNSPGGPWTRALSQTLVHEWMHGIDWILEQLAYPVLPSSDSCPQYGYTPDNDPGWARCLKYFLSLIEPDAYVALENWPPIQQTGTISIITTPVSGRILIDGIYKGDGRWEDTINTGSHTVYFGIVSGYTTPSQKTVNVEVDKTTYVMGVYTIISTTGSVRFHTNPDTAEVWSGGILLGTTDSSGILLVSNLPTGNLDFIIKKIGYNDSPTQIITVGVNSIIDVSLITLSPIVVTAGFGGIGMIMMVGIAIGAIYNATKKNIISSNFTPITEINK